MAYNCQERSTYVNPGQVALYHRRSVPLSGAIFDCCVDHATVGYDCGLEGKSYKPVVLGEQEAENDFPRYVETLGDEWHGKGLVHVGSVDHPIIHVQPYEIGVYIAGIECCGPGREFLGSSGKIKGIHCAKAE